MKRTTFIYTTLLVSMIFLSPGCIQVFSDLQSARLVGKNNIEFTPSFSAVYFTDEDTSMHVQNHLGMQLALGLHPICDLRTRYEYITAHYDDESVDVSVLGVGPKLGLVQQGPILLALNMPIGFAFGSDIETSETWEFHPTMIATMLVGDYIEINQSTKALIPLHREEGEIYVAFNVGAGFSNNFSKWAVRPETGLLINPGEGGLFYHFSIGLTFSP